MGAMNKGIVHKKTVKCGHDRRNRNAILRMQPKDITKYLSFNPYDIVWKPQSNKSSSRTAAKTKGLAKEDATFKTVFHLLKPSRL